MANGERGAQDTYVCAHKKHRGCPTIDKRLQQAHVWQAHARQQTAPARCIHRGRAARSAVTPSAVKISKDRPSLVQDVARSGLRAEMRTVVPGTDRGRAASCARHARGLRPAIHVMHIQSRGTHSAGDDGGEGGEETRDKVEHSANIGGLSLEEKTSSALMDITSRWQMQTH
jgi:hypothetical protein